MALWLLKFLLTSYHEVSDGRSLFYHCISVVLISCKHLSRNQIKGSSDFPNSIWCFVFCLKCHVLLFYTDTSTNWSDVSVHSFKAFVRGIAVKWPIPNNLYHSGTRVYKGVLWNGGSKDFFSWEGHDEKYPPKKDKEKSIWTCHQGFQRKTNCSNQCELT